jgi:hypothetical protein
VASLGAYFLKGKAGHNWADSILGPEFRKNECPSQ